MIELSVYNREGKEVETVKVDEAVFGGTVRYALLKQAVVMYHANKRVGTVATKSRGMVAGSTRKLYKQKGTGNARMGNIRTNVRRGGGVAFAKTTRDFRQDMPKKQRRLAADSAVLAKIQSNNIVLVHGLSFDQPKTKDFSAVLGNLKIDRSCLIMTADRDNNVYLSARNIPKVMVLPIADINAGDVCSHIKLLFTKDAFLSLVNSRSVAESVTE